MRVLDVNVLVNALRPEAPGHRRANEVLDGFRASAESVLILTEVAAGFLRVVTHRSVFAHPEDANSAMAALRSWCSAPNFRIGEAGPGRWNEFESLMPERALIAGGIHDGLLAAACIDLGGALVTFDHGFQRFEGLNLQLLSA